MSIFTPLVNYAGKEHVLNALPCFVHPGNGNVYWIAIVKVGGVQQDLEVYRVRPSSPAREFVHRFVGGGVDAQTQIAAGGCVILPDGSLQAGASADPVGGTPITKSGFVGGFWPAIPNVDDPYPLGGAGGVLFDKPVTTPAWEGRTLYGGEVVDVPAVFGVPPAAIYQIRFVAQAPAPNIRVRAGTQAAPYFVTVNTQVANQQVHTGGPTPGPSVYVSSVDSAGQPATSQVWLQICGYSL